MQPTPFGVAIAMLVLPACSREDPLEPPVPEAGVVLDDTLLAIVDDQSSRVRARPRDVGARMRLAAIYDANGLDPLAARAYEQVTRLAPRHAPAWYHLARVRSRLGDPATAEAALLSAIDAAPSYVPARWRLGRLLLSEGRIDEAARAFEGALAVEPADPDAAIGLARVALERDDPAAAAARLEAVVLAHPGDGRARRLLARARAAAGDEEAARALLEGDVPAASFRLDPWTREVRAMRVGVRGELAEALADADDARDPRAVAAALETVAEERPDDLGVLEELVRALERAGEPDRALAVLEERRRRFPGHHRVELLASAARWRRGDLEGALEHARTAVGCQPGHAPAHQHLAALLDARGDAAGAAAARAEARRLGAAVGLAATRREPGDE